MENSKWKGLEVDIGFYANVLKQQGSNELLQNLVFMGFLG